MELSANLKRIRNDKNLSQEDVAELVGVSRQAVAKWENGTAYPDIDNLLALSESLCVTTDSLIKPNSHCENRSATAQRLAYDEIIEFLLRAGRATYAGKGKENDKPSRPNSHDLQYTEGQYSYIDSYVGGERFTGEEIVLENDLPIWAMNYTGRTLGDSFSGDFLKEALLLRPKDMPYRGPQLYQNGGYVYHNSVQGDFLWFDGREEIFYNDTKVYECLYHGGIVK